ERVEDKVYTDKTASISGVQYRYTNSVPIIVGAKYYPHTNNDMLMPYVGAGLGTTYTNRATDFGLYRITTNTWQFCLRPELGVRIKGPSGMDLMVGGKYYANFNNDELDGQSFLSLNVGFIFHTGH
ncbi:porin family protein, partial [Chitinophagaceae bacterium LB-8]